MNNTSHKLPMILKSLCAVVVVVVVRCWFKIGTKSGMWRKRWYVIKRGTMYNNENLKRMNTILSNEQNNEEMDTWMRNKKKRTAPGVSGSIQSLGFTTVPLSSVIVSPLLNAPWDVCVLLKWEKSQFQIKLCVELKVEVPNSGPLGTPSCVAFWTLNFPGTVGVWQI